MKSIFQAVVIREGFSQFRWLAAEGLGHGFTQSDSDFILYTDDYEKPKTQK
jgi:hypothetical protein